MEKDSVSYQSGFGNTFESEALKGSLPRGRNNPKKVPYGLYAEQLSGTAFTVPRHLNRRVWLYRIQPSVGQDYTECHGTEYPRYFGHFQDTSLNPTPIRWQPMPLLEDSQPVDFVQGTVLFSKSGDVKTKNGLAMYIYAFNSSMDHVHLYNADGDFLFVPQEGTLKLQSELGILIVHPKEICVIPRGVVFSVHLYNCGNARGYVLEVYKGHFVLPELGPIGSNGLANARDFLYPTASYCDNKTEYNKECTIMCKFGSQLFCKESPHSPYNVVAWHGNYLPFKYNLESYCAINSVTYDHLDPSIYTVLTCVGDEPGTALADFVIFPPRMMATDENTLRPPWFHRNTMSEFMGLICGSYDAKRGGFVPGGASLHSCMTPHGPDGNSYNAALQQDTSTPKKLEGGLAFMFETSLQLEISKYALECEFRDKDYSKCWQTGLQDTFTGWNEDQDEKEQP